MVKGLQPGDPQTIGPYRLVGQLGSGGMGRVFLGVSAGGRPVAVKVVRAELAADPEFRNRFGREVAAARRVSGVFTAMVVDADVDGPVAWLATAYVPGPSLAEAIHDHGRPRCAWLRVLLPGCLPERVLPGERSSVIIPGHVTAGERACLRIRACLPAGVRLPQPPLVRLPVPDPGLAHVQGPDPDADHIGADLDTDTDTDHLSTDIAEHTHVGHVGGHSIIRIGTRVWVAAPGEKGLRLVEDRAAGPGVGSEDEMAQRLDEGPFVVDSQVESRFG